MATAIIPHIITQHAEDASFLWLLRDRAVYAPQFDLKYLAKLDQRVEANLDGLRIAGDPGWEICKEVLGLEDAGEVFACAVLAFEGGYEDRISDVLEKGSAAPALSRGVASALGWLPLAKADKYIQLLISARSPALRRVAVAAGAIHRHLSQSALGDALTDSDALVRARACRAAGELGQTALLADLRKNQTAEQEDCRFYAAWSAARLGDEASLPILLSFAESKSRHREKAMQMAMRVAEPPLARVWVRKLAAMPDGIRLAIQAAGALGAPEEVPWLIDLMIEPELARVAAESFTMITGADLDRDYLKGEKPKDFAAGPTENPEDEDVDMDPDEHLPWPKRETVQKWWVGHQHEFADGTRYLLGKPLPNVELQQILRFGRQRQRAAAALEMALRQGGPLFEERAPGFRQLQSFAGLE
jgi:uncharacterized protein (TIGR02270 family)